MGVIKLKPEVKAAWVEALRSGRYFQVRGQLRTEGLLGQPEAVAYCCLGVLCDLATQAGVIDADADWRLNRCREVPRHEISEWVIESVDGTPYDVWMKYRQEGSVWFLGGMHSLPLLNDTGSTFSEIADVIERRF